MDYQPEKLVMHACCAICASEITGAMKAGYAPVAFFSNPNIYPEDEYLLRRDAMRMSAERNGIPFVEDEYDRSGWKDIASPFAEESEGGRRCALCFALRLRRAADFAVRSGITNITTTLAASPYKDETLIREIGIRIAGERGLVFIDPLTGRDKRIAWKKALGISKEAGYYRQGYCGCEYSLKPRVKEG